MSSIIQSGPAGSEPLVSIVIPAFNSERYLAGTVASVQAQTMPDWELHIVDDGSSDRTFEIAQELAAADERIYVIRQDNRGVSSARNAGIEASRAPYIAFVDADDLWLPHCLDVLHNAITQHPEWTGVYGLGQYIDANGTVLPGEALENWARNRLRVEGNRRVGVPLGEAATTFEMLSVRNYIPIGAVLFRSDLLKAEGGFPSHLRGMEDWHLWARLSLRGPVGFVDDVVFQYRRHERNASGDRWMMHREQYNAARDLYETCRLSSGQRRSFLRSQPVLCHLYWARAEACAGRLGSAARHLSIATRNVIDFHLIPRLARRKMRLV